MSVADIDWRNLLSHLSEDKSSNTTRNSVYAEEDSMPLQFRNVTVELQRIACLFQATAFISEAEFVINCKRIMTVLWYSRSGGFNFSQRMLLLDAVENAVITFLIRLLPLAFQEPVAPSSHMHPASLPMIASLLEAIDVHIREYEDFESQLRMSAIHQLLRDNGDVSSVVFMCQLIPGVQASANWQPPDTIKTVHLSSCGDSLSLPELHVSSLPVLLNKPLLSFSNSPAPSRSSLFSCSSTSLHSIVSEVVNMSTSDRSNSTCICFSSTPELSTILADRNTPGPRPASTAQPIVGYNRCQSFDPDVALRELLSLSSQGHTADMCPTVQGRPTLDMADLAAQLPPLVNLGLSRHEPIRNSQDISIFPQGGHSRHTLSPDIGQGPPPPSLFGPNLDAPYTHSTSASTISVDPLLFCGHDLGISTMRKSDPIRPLSLSTTTHSPSPLRIIAKNGMAGFRNAFKTGTQNCPPSTHNQLLRNASNHAQPIMRRAVYSKRTVSAATKTERPLDPDLAALILPSPPKRKTTEIRHALGHSPHRGVIASKQGKARIVIENIGDSAPPRHRWQRGPKNICKSTDENM